MSILEEVAFAQEAEAAQQIARDAIATATAFAKRVDELEAELARERSDESAMEIKYEDAKHRAEAAEKRVAELSNMIRHCYTSDTCAGCVVPHGDRPTCHPSDVLAWLDGISK